MIEVTTFSAKDRAVYRTMTLAPPQAIPRIPSDFLAKRMQRLTAAQSAPDRMPGVCVMSAETVQRNVSRPRQRLLRQASRPLRVMTVPKGGNMRLRSPIRRDAEFRTATPLQRRRFVPPPPAVLGGKELKKFVW
ncbi:hypothetical protein PHO31112_01061 [Pandoraea horticolens]|uniref:Uncharacterized protein n=1 Tax=Pandoraea horticolens TaxID=2508298 RepID=A0A5E4SWU9_9BURK|nr:hypothetical protein [Pandoraea horticolens]VVD80250.1 hypothetical protein PHO31112_01061 [Pandoraea horticolens]